MWNILDVQGLQRPHHSKTCRLYEAKSLLFSEVSQRLRGRITQLPKLDRAVVLLNPYSEFHYIWFQKWGILPLNLIWKTVCVSNTIFVRDEKYSSR